MADAPIIDRGDADRRARRLLALRGAALTAHLCAARRARAVH
jgi:hypothetical protein